MVNKKKNPLPFFFGMKNVIDFVSTIIYELNCLNNKLF